MTSALRISKQSAWWAVSSPWVDDGNLVVIRREKNKDRTRGCQVPSCFNSAIGEFIAFKVLKHFKGGGQD